MSDTSSEQKLKYGSNGEELTCVCKTGAQKAFEAVLNHPDNKNRQIDTTPEAMERFYKFSMGGQLPNCRRCFEKAGHPLASGKSIPILLIEHNEALTP